MRPGRKTFAVLLLFVALVLVNYLASEFPGRVDMTAERIYTLSPGTTALLAKIEEPVTLDYYFTRTANGVPIAYKNYADRIQEMLRQYVRASGGRLILNVIDPRPDSPEEEQATNAGLQPQMLQSGDPFQFGLVALQADQQKVISNFNPQREQFLEYDLSQLIYSVQQFDKKKLGLISTLPLQAPRYNPMLQQGPPPPSQFVVSEWARTFEIVPIEPDATEIPPGLDALAVVHPQDLPPALQFAIDQFVLGGKPVLLALDPSSQYSKRQGSQGMFAPPPNVASDLPLLLNAYGIAYDAQKVVGDLENATQVNIGRQVVRYPVWLSLPKSSFNPKNLMTSRLDSAMFAEPGSVALKPGSQATFTPLIETSPQSGEISTETMMYTQPEDIAQHLTPSGKKTIAALITGKFKSAFPDGAPKAEAAPKAGDNAAAKAPAPAEKPKVAALKESPTSSTLLVVADSDWLLDDYSVRKTTVLGQTVAEPVNDNLPFATNSLEFLTGSADLLSIRGKGSSMRPFTVVRAMEVEANKKYQQKLAGLESRLNEAQAKLAELQNRKSEGHRLVATPEVEKAIEDFQQQLAVMRGERRDIRKALREGIESLENRLLIINLLATPVMVGLFGLWFHRFRRHRPSPSTR